MIISVHEEKSHDLVCYYKNDNFKKKAFILKGNWLLKVVTFWLGKKCRVWLRREVAGRARLGGQKHFDLVLCYLVTCFVFLDFLVSNFKINKVNEIIDFRSLKTCEGREVTSN